MSAEMKNTLVESKLLRDGYRCVKHASGLTVFIYPKAEMRSTYAVFGTRYGSIDKVFKRSDEDKAETTPAGIAHFLEHKLFESEDLGFVGEIREVNTKIVEDAIASGYTPVISTVAAGYHGEVYNINADVAAARIAAELGARKLILMTDIVGLLRDKDDENTLIPVVNVSDVPKLKRDGIISGGMIPKIDCCVEAVRRGVERAHIIDGRTPHSILVELFTDEGIGTMFY